VVTDSSVLMQDSVTITRQSASNLALSFIILGREKREAMEVLYAFCREVDDVADDDSRSVEERRCNLKCWRDDVRRACDGNEPQKTLNKELKPIVEKYGLDFSLFDELIRGVEMDLSQDRCKTWEDLDLYCHRVASVVGLLSIEIFGYCDKGCCKYAHHLGRALQLTNILRDVRNDAARSRIYLPVETLKKHNVDEIEVLNLNYTDGFYQVALEVAARARDHYQKATEVLPEIDRRSMIAAESMGAVYWQLFKRIERERFNVFGEEPIRLRKLHKIWLILRTWFRVRSGSKMPNYGMG